MRTKDDEIGLLFFATVSIRWLGIPNSIRFRIDMPDPAACFSDVYELPVSILPQLVQIHLIDRILGIHARIELQHMQRMKLRLP